MSPYTRVKLGRDSSGRPLVINQRTANMLADAERRLGYKLTIVQGSYMAGHAADASSHTHDQGGVVDLRSWDIAARQRSVQQAVKVLRKVGFAAWYRTKAQGFDPHIHAVAIGDEEMHPEAAQQVVDYRHGLNGLTNRRRDDGPRVLRIRTWPLVRRIVDVRLAERELERWRLNHQS